MPPITDISTDGHSMADARMGPPRPILLGQTQKGILEPPIFEQALETIPIDMVLNLKDVSMASTISAT
jgi:hypothetical protein